MRLSLVLLSLVFCTNLLSQGEFNNWYFGDKAGITFNTIPPSPLTNCAGSFFSLLNPGAISDSSGNLLFYANWTYVYNKNHQVMLNGSGLSSLGSVDQQCFIMQSLSDDSLYYLFTMDSHLDPVFNPDAKGLCYSVVDMRLDGGLGGIVPGLKNVQVMGAGQTSDALTLTRHRNNRDAWIVVREYNNSNKFLAYKITASGINPLPVISNSLITLNWTLGDGTELRHIKISPDGEKLVCVYEFVAEVCSINSTSGVITPLFLFDSPSVFPLMDSQIEFSLNSRHLYAGYPTGSNNISNIYQYDMSFTDSASFVQSAVQVGQTRDAMGFQRGPDGKIYVTVQQVDSVGVINFPNVSGMGCDFHRSVIGLQGNVSYSGFPQFLQRYYLYINQNGRCMNDSVTFTYVTWPPADSIYWNFGDPLSGLFNTSNLPEPYHLFSSPGDYTITLIIRHNDNRIDTATRLIHIFDVPDPIIGPDQFICAGDSVTLDAGFCAGCTYKWDNIAAGQINIGNGQSLTVYDSGLYVVHVTNTNGCTGRDTVQISFSPVPLFTTTPLSKSICSGESTNIPLSSNVPAATFTWTASLSSGNVSGFSDGSGTSINQILTNNSTTQGVVTYQITPRVGDCKGDTTDYQVTVDPLDTASVSIAATSTTVCTGTLVTFTATPINGGTAPSYQWQVNGVNAGMNSPVFTYLPFTNDHIQCILTSSDTVCIANNPDTSNVITMTVNTNLPISVSVIPSENPFCIGTPVTFNATPVNGGTTPSFQWKVNGVSVGPNSPIYTYIPASMDLVSCILTSSEICTTNNPDTSVAITMTGFPGLPADVTITASPSPSCQGVPVTFTATPINGGSNPSYQWQVNGINVGTNNLVYTYIPAPLDLVSCIMTSNLACVTNNPASSILYQVSIIPAPAVTFTPCFDTITNTNARPIRLKGGIPLGGTYTGPGVNAGYFYPNLAGAGTHVITYTYTNAGNCSDVGYSIFDVRSASPFVCGGNLTDIRDGKVYPTVQIGGQCWFAADLDYGFEILSSVHQRDNCISEKYTTHPSPLTAHSFYQWDELMAYDPTPANQGLCPPEWHIPTEAEWATLFANWTNNAFAAAPLKYSGYSGFNAFLLGARHQNVQWDYQNFATFFWSSTAYGPYKAWAHGMNDPDYSVSYYPSLRSNAFSVRCLRD
jgi:uncharacterized protein (TIGR02145 family)